MNGAYRQGPSGLAASVAIFLAMSAAYVAFWTLFPTLPAGAAGNDALFLADGARRIALGQTPHVDFHLPTGVEPYLSWLAASKLLPNWPTYIASQLVGFLLLSPIVVAAGAAIERPVERLAFFAAVGMAALLPFNSSLPDFYGVSFHSSYNRLGSAFSLAYLVWVFRADRFPLAAMAAVTAFAMLFAFFLKIVLIGVVLAPAVVLAVLDARLRKALLAALVVFGLVLAGIELATGVVSAYVADIRTMSKINAGAVPYFFASFIFRTFALHALAAVLIAWLTLDALRDARRDREPLLSLRFAARLARPVAMAAAAAALTFSESQATHGVEYFAIAGLLFAPDIIERAGSTARLGLAIAAFTLSVGVLAITCFENGLGTALARKGPSVEVGWVERFLPHVAVPATMLARAEAIADLWSRDADRPDASPRPELVDRGDSELYLAQWKTVDDALKTLGPSAPPLGAVTTLANADLFGLALRAEPARGVEVVDDVGRSIPAMGTEQARRNLARVDSVFAPTCVIDKAPGTELMSKLFAEALATDFEPQKLTACWTLHRRKAAR